MTPDLDMLIALFRFLPLPIAFFFAARNRQVMPAFITVLYAAVILFGPSVLKWQYEVAIFATPMSYIIAWYIIKNTRKPVIIRKG